MLSFVAEFPIDPKHNRGGFLKAVKGWILKSPHTALKAGNLDSISLDGATTIGVGGDKIETLMTSNDVGESAAIRYTQDDGDISWETTVVFSRTSQDAWVAIRTSRESRHPAVRLPPARKPIIVRNLLNDLGGGIDGPLTVSEAPHRLTNNDIDLAGRLISGGAESHLPIVYVSCKFDGSHAINETAIARDLSGMAHVVLEPNRPFSRRLQIEVNSANVYGGTIGVYWPHGQGRRSIFLRREFDDETSLRKAITDEVRAALTNRRPLSRCTWSAVQETTSRIAFNSLKASGSHEVEKYVEAFDAELKAKDELIADAEREIARLQAEVRKHESRMTSGTGVSLRTGLERDLLRNEMLDVVLDSLRDAESRAIPDSRRHHIISAILDNNPRTGLIETKRTEIKEMLRDYTSMDAKTRKGLEGLGFSISADGKHHKLIYQEDDRYTFILSKSSSDHRAGLNCASDISKKIL